MTRVDERDEELEIVHPGRLDVQTRNGGSITHRISLRVLADVTVRQLNVNCDRD
jgi:hypothetical protein